MPKGTLTLENVKINRIDFYPEGSLKYFTFSSLNVDKKTEIKTYTRYVLFVSKNYSLPRETLNVIKKLQEEQILQKIVMSDFSILGEDRKEGDNVPHSVRILGYIQDIVVD